MALKEGYTAAALTVHYGQAHEKEITCARQIASDLAVEHHVIPITLPWKGSALIDPSIQIPKGRDVSQMANAIPETYVPARNSIFLSMAASFAEARGAETVFIGANALDYSGYPDCRPNYLKAFEELMRLGTKVGVEGKAITIQAPLLKLSKREIVQWGTRLNVPFEKTWSCYEGKELPCGTCDSCVLRIKGFQEAGLQDPLMAYAPSAQR